jgi:TonB family protein
MFLCAQEVITLDESAARHNLTKSPEAIYPPIAKAAHVTGSVTIEIQVDASGHVSSAKVLGGPPMLQGAAVDAVKTWEFKPFQKDGQPISATTKITIPFSSGTPDANDEQIASVYFPLSQTCIKLVGQYADYADQARACREAAAEADKFGQDTRFIERRSSYVYCATAVRNNASVLKSKAHGIESSQRAYGAAMRVATKEMKDALSCADKAVAVVQQGHDDIAGTIAAYEARATVEYLIGDFGSLFRDLIVAEQFARSALDTPAGKAMGHQLKLSLNNLLVWHANLLREAHLDSEAEAKAEEARKLWNSK